jgi:general secretion pathway protein C
MLKRYFWLVYLLLVTVIAAVGADLTKSYVSARLAAPRTLAPTQTSTTPQQPTPTTLDDYQVIDKRNIFNATPAPPSPEPQPQPQPQPQLQPVPTQLQLKLVGTVAGADSQYFAIIEDLSKRGTQALYHIGDIVQNAVVAEIRRMCVV